MRTNAADAHFFATTVEEVSALYDVHYLFSILSSGQLYI